MNTVLRSSIAIVVLAGLTPVVAQESGGLINSIPENAKVAILVKDIGQLEKDCRDFVDKLGLPLPIPEIEFDMLLETLGVEGKLGKQGALVVTDASPAGVTIILEFEDIDAVKESPGVEPGDQPDTYIVDLMGNRAVALVKGSRVYLQMDVQDAKGLEIFKSEKESLLSKLTEHQKKVFDATDVFFTVNVREWRTMALEGLEYAEEQLKIAMEQAGPIDANELGIPGMDVEKILQGYLDVGRTIITDTRYFYGGIDVTADAINMNMSAQFESGSAMEKNFPAGGKPTSELLAGLPDRTFFIAAGVDYKSFASLMESMNEWAFNLFADALDDEARQKLRKSMEYMASLESTNFLFDMADANGMAGVGFMRTDDPARVLKGLQEESMADMEFLGELAEGYSKPIEKTVEGRKVVEITIDYSSMAGELENELGAGEMPNPFEIMFGEEMKLVMQYTEVDGGVAMTMGSFENPILMLDDKSVLLKSDRATAVLSKLPKNAAMIGLMDTLNLVQFSANLMKGMGLPIDMPALPPSTQPPPIGFAMTTQKGIMSLDVVAPSEHIQAVANYFMQLAMQMQNAQPPGVEAPQF